MGHWSLLLLGYSPPRFPSGVVSVCVCVCVCVARSGGAWAMSHEMWSPFLNRVVGTWFLLEEGMRRNHETFLVQNL